METAPETGNKLQEAVSPKESESKAGEGEGVEGEVPVVTTVVGIMWPTQRELTPLNELVVNELVVQRLLGQG